MTERDLQNFITQNKVDLSTNAFWATSLQNKLQSTQRKKEKKISDNGKVAATAKSSKHTV